MTTTDEHTAAPVAADPPMREFSGPPGPPPAPGPPKDVKIKPAKVEKPAPANPVVQMRPLAVAGANVAGGAVSTALYTGTGWVLALIAGVLVALASLFVGRRMNLNHASTGSVFKWPHSRTGSSSGGRRGGGAGSGGGGRGSGLLGRLGRGGAGRTSGAASGGTSSRRGAGAGASSGGLGRRLAGLLGGGDGSGTSRRRQRGNGPTTSTGPHPIGASRRSRSGKGKTAGNGGPDGGTGPDGKKKSRKDSKKERDHKTSDPATTEKKTRPATVDNKIDDPGAGTKERRPALGPIEDPTAEPGEPAGDNDNSTSDRELVATGRMTMPGTAASGGTGGSIMTALIKEAEEMLKIASTFQRPEGAMDIIKIEYPQIPKLIELLTKVWVTAHARATDPRDGDPVPAAVTKIFEDIAKVSAAQVQVAEKIPALAEKLTQREQDALKDARNRRWGHDQNKGYAA